MAAFVGAMTNMPTPGSGAAGGAATLLAASVDGFGNGTWSSNQPLSFSVGNEYGTMVSEYKWSHIVEPSRVTTLTAKLLDEYISDSGGKFEWTIDGDKNESFVVSKAREDQQHPPPAYPPTPLCTQSPD